MSENPPGVLDGAIAPMRNTVLFGHAQAETFLAQGFRSGKGHHAILIEGPEGIGKATLAFRFANYVLCNPEPENAPSTLPDPDVNSLASRQIASGASHNLLHLTKPVDEKTGKVKSAITVDEVRRAGHFFSQTAGGGGWRIVIIDAADDLNRNAANAILKILEEPPKRSLFLVLSHAPGRLLPTIRSRCQPLRLTPLGDEDLSRSLQHLGVGFRDPEQQQAVMTLAGGSVARALKLVNYGGLDIIEAFDRIMQGSGASARRAMQKLAEVLSAKDSDAAFGFFTDHLADYLMQQARSAALAGDMAQADRYAQLTETVNERFVIAAGYNLDRKQTILDTFADMGL